jgi:undecaprenyl diphosphate synthase
MDGNGRWAAERRLPRPFGHRAGMKAVREAVEGAIEAGVEVLTLFAFSEENWSRPAPEISALMDLLEEYIAREVVELCGQGVRVHVLGDRSRLTPGGRAAVERVERETAAARSCRSISAFVLAARGNCLRGAVAAEEVLKGTKRSASMKRRSAASRTRRHGPIPSADPHFRRAAHLHFPLWQPTLYRFLHHAQVVADFNRRTLFDAILDYQRRDRRFGKVTASSSSR